MEFNKQGAGLNSAAEQKEKLRVALIIRDRLGRLVKSRKKNGGTVSFHEVSCKKKNHFNRRALF